MIEIVRTDESNVDFLRLVTELDAELRVRDGEDHAFYAQYNKPIGLLGVVLAVEEVLQSVAELLKNTWVTRPR